ncbi:YjbH domain-containing protein [Planctobacterium marinum]|uniref:YjbH domain-containing protein n=1 Tax=Planctobacterium marinum TaxID=1631968 RepID=UPI001E62E962|nr:YjbH domain-containing protein [Planctobacterium marinum]MCC2606404.1 YjbH domain-containing protein [Planctobacterium marinum]
MSFFYRTVCSLAITAALFPAHANEADSGYHHTRLPYSQGDLGGVGLLQTPTARMLNEGDMVLGYKDNGEYRFWTASLQLFPWMEATVRYTDFRNLLYSEVPEFSGDQTAKDKGIDVKFRLLQESLYLPQVAVGFRDFGGTGFFESEYITASKRLGDFDFHLGLGFGYLGNAGSVSNPFCDIADRFCERKGFGGFGDDQGGQINFDDFFSGNTSLIAGLEYQTPWEPLRVKIEYEGNDYTRERAQPLEQDSRWNFGVNYRYNDFDFGLSWERGNTFGFSVNYAFNFHTASQAKVQPQPQSLKDRDPDVSVQDVGQFELMAKVSQSGLIISNTVINKDQYIVYGSRTRYRDEQDAIERMGRAMAAKLPDSVKSYHIVETAMGMPLVETVIDAPEFIKVANYETLEHDISTTWKRQEPSQEVIAKKQDKQVSGFFANLDTFWIQTFGSPEAFYLYQGGLYGTGGYAFNSNFRITGGVKAILLENMDKFNFKVDNYDSPVPRVRTYIREYVRKSRVSVDTLFANWVDQIAPNTYAQVYAGYLETMYGGIGGEIFYQEVDSNFGFGLDLNYVKQRSFENDYDFRDYEALTGHASVYWKPSFWKDVQLSFNVGQFLAEDKGVNVEFARRFDSGIVVGAYAALTDISAEDYGEGSFTKGFYISIPFDLFSLRPSTGRGRIPWVPIARDGGQPLNRPVKLNSISKIRSPFVD